MDGWSSVATLLLHASALLVCGGLLLCLMRGAGVATRQRVWRTALFGAVLTMPLQALLPAFGGGADPSAHDQQATTAAALVEADAPPIATKVVELPVPATLVLVPPDDAALVGTVHEAAPVAPPLAPLPAESLAPAEAAPAPVWAALDWHLLGWAWLLVVGWFLARDAWLRSRLTSAVRELRSVDDVQLRTLFVRLRRRADVTERARLLLSTKDGSPHVVGGRHPRVVLPQRAINELEEDELEALLAHELGHIRRRDDLWIRAERVMRALLFFHPLAWRAVKSLRGLAELDADARAVATTGRPDALASCLTSVATWLVTPAAGRVVPAMAQPRSMLGRRVRCLLSETPARSAHPRLALAACLVVLGLAVGYAPRVEASATPSAEPHVRAPATHSGELEREASPDLDLATLPDPEPVRLDPRVVAEFIELDAELTGLQSDVQQLGRMLSSRAFTHRLDANERQLVATTLATLRTKMTSMLKRRDAVLMAIAAEMNR